jgi:hypothetical protein
MLGSVVCGCIRIIWMHGLDTERKIEAVAWASLGKLGLLGRTMEEFRRLRTEIDDDSWPSMHRLDPGVGRT